MTFNPLDPLGLFKGTSYKAGDTVLYRGRKFTLIRSLEPEEMGGESGARGDIWELSSTEPPHISAQARDVYFTMVTPGQVLITQVDKNFAREMKAHHEQAVMMSQRYLQEGTDIRLQRLANKIIRDQEDEIKFLEDWLR